MQTPLELQIQTLPDNPGVYQYFDKKKERYCMLEKLKI